MSIVDRFQEYIDTEIPIFRPGWLCKEFEQPTDSLADSARSESIDIHFRRGSTIYLADPEQRSKGKPRPTLRRINFEPNKFGKGETPIP